MQSQLRIVVNWYLNTKRIRRRRKSEIAISMPILCDPEPLALAADHVTRVVLGVEIMLVTSSTINIKHRLFRGRIRTRILNRPLRQPSDISKCQGLAPQHSNPTPAPKNLGFWRGILYSVGAWNPFLRCSKSRKKKNSHATHTPVGRSQWG